MLSRNGKNNENGSFNWGDALADAAIMAGLSFFTTLGATMFTGVNQIQAAIAAGIAAATQFFAILALKRGLREKPNE